MTKYKMINQTQKNKIFVETYGWPMSEADIKISLSFLGTSAGGPYGNSGINSILLRIGHFSFALTLIS